MEQTNLSEFDIKVEKIKKLEEMGVPREDSALLLPLGMTTKIVCKHTNRIQPSATHKHDDYTQHQ